MPYSRKGINKGTNLRLQDPVETFCVTNVSLISRFYQRPLLQDISFTVRQGERLGVIGAAGAGKTLLLKILNRLVGIDQGTILFRDQPLATYPAVRLRQQVLFVSEMPSLLDMTVSQALQYPLSLQGISPATIQARISELCERGQIPQEWLALREVSLSSPQRQWVSLIRAFLINPSVLLLDNPFTHLEHSQAEQLLPLLQNFAGAVLISAQSPQSLKPICDRILWLDQGHIRQVFTPDQMDWEALEAQIGPSSSDQDDW
jgi:D-methionine transport system ATP-binding protein